MLYDLSTPFNFLQRLSKNNNREWFNANKATYQQAHENIISFADSLLDELGKYDVIETPNGKKSLHRIYRDVRFSKDKTPYNTHFSGGFSRATAQRRGGYYFRIGPEKVFIAGGFWGPNKDDLLHIRKQIVQEGQEMRNIITDGAFTDYFGELKGEKLKTAPKGFDKEHPEIDLLRYKQFLLVHEFDIKEAAKTNFHIKMAEGFNKMRPFFNLMSEFLTTDLNGTPLE